MSTVLCISAHPDDETLFCGGTLAKFSRQGHSVFILETTRGEGGEVGDPPLTIKENLGAFREKEARHAARALGVEDIFFLPFIDPHMEINGTARHIDVPLNEFAAAINAHVRELAPDLIITHGSNGEYGHPQHIYTHEATRLALNNGNPEIALVSWAAWYTPCKRERILNPDDAADIIADISPWHEMKVNAVLCHKTQHAMFLRNTGAPAVHHLASKTESFHIWKGPLPGDLKLD